MIALAQQERTTDEVVAEIRQQTNEFAALVDQVVAEIRQQQEREQRGE